VKKRAYLVKRRVADAIRRLAGDDDGQMMPWETAGREAVQQALANAVFAPGTVTLPSLEEHEADTVCRSLEDLTQELMDIYLCGWDGEAPYDGGVPVFDGHALAEACVEVFLSGRVVFGNLRAIGWSP
jgi:hypothetical protein